MHPISLTGMVVAGLLLAPAAARGQGADSSGTPAPSPPPRQMQLRLPSSDCPMLVARPRGADSMPMARAQGSGQAPMPVVRGDCTNPLDHKDTRPSAADTAGGAPVPRKP